VLNAIPVLCANVPELRNSAQAATNAALATLRAAVAAFEEAAEALLAAAADAAATTAPSTSSTSDIGGAGTSGNSGSRRCDAGNIDGYSPASRAGNSIWSDTHDFIQGCRFFMTGNLHWR
jgi:type IV secretory pathway TrbL component